MRREAQPAEVQPQTSSGDGGDDAAALVSWQGSQEGRAEHGGDVGSGALTVNAKLMLIC